MHKRYPQANITAKDVVDASMTVLRTVGMGLLESVYERCLEHELRLRGHQVEHEARIAIMYKGLRVEAPYRADLLVDGCVVVELKSIEGAIRYEHKMQLLSYMKLLDYPIGLVINFGPNEKRRTQRVILKDADKETDAPPF